MSVYPQGLRARDISLEARIVCIADVVESLTAHRPYRPAHKIEEALSLINQKAGKWYDPRVVDICTRLFAQGYHIDTIDLDTLTWLTATP